MLASGINCPSAEPRRASYALSYVLRRDSADGRSCHLRSVFPPQMNTAGLIRIVWSTSNEPRMRRMVGPTRTRR
ncbi:hypothetical protein Y032_0164g3539 [Ancylostoma ceylanicum]|uniref:Uncharacterized protein n=1 Tax=Ancylostoma ceylanicum TaxID=53326 RepID=A0A016SXD4_9BILA|nr:hypothetical protein Y032_0164g3539 [Ancylostoma ceylanicum]